MRSGLGRTLCKLVHGDECFGGAFWVCQSVDGGSIS
jgi:hypothetical protein